MFAAGQKAEIREQVHQLIITLRKAMAQQKHLEASCQRANLPIDYRWSINNVSTEPTPRLDVVTLRGEPEVSS